MLWKMGGQMSNTSSTDPTKLCFSNLLHPWSLTWNLQIDPWKTKFLLETIIFRFHVKLWGCILADLWNHPWYPNSPFELIEGGLNPKFSRKLWGQQVASLDLGVPLCLLDSLMATSTPDLRIRSWFSVSAKAPPLIEGVHWYPDQIEVQGNYAVYVVSSLSKNAYVQIENFGPVSL